MQLTISKRYLTLCDISNIKKLHFKQIQPSNWAKSYHVFDFFAVCKPAQMHHGNWKMCMTNARHPSMAKMKGFSKVVLLEFPTALKCSFRPSLSVCTNIIHT